MDALKYDKGKIVGLDEQLEALKTGEDSGFLFGIPTEPVQFTTPSQSFKQMSDSSARSIMGLPPEK